MFQNINRVPLHTTADYVGVLGSNRLRIRLGLDLLLDFFAAGLHLILGFQQLLLLALPVGLHGIDLRVHLVLLGECLLDELLDLRGIRSLLLALTGCGQHFRALRRLRKKQLALGVL